MDAGILLDLLKREPPLRPHGLRWEVVQRDNSQIIIFPSEPHPILYRGQTARHQPCLPTISRGLPLGVTALSALSEQAQAAIAVNLTRSEWFNEVLKQHPAIIWSRSQNIFVDPIAVAQHYGIPTGYIDVTESLEVASFFATCFYQEGRWHPMTSGVGVVYRILWKNFEHPLDLVRPIGLQPFPRPSEQWGWTLALNLGEDFEDVPYLQKLEFEHRRDVSEFFLHRFNNGIALFPPDPLATVAERVQKSVQLPNSTLRSVFDDLTADPQGLTCSFEELSAAIERFFHIQVVAEVPAVVQPAEEKLMSEIWSERKDQFFKSVGFRLARTRR